MVVDHLPSHTTRLIVSLKPHADGTFGFVSSTARSAAQQGGPGLRKLLTAGLGPLVLLPPAAAPPACAAHPHGRQCHHHNQQKQ